MKKITLIILTVLILILGLPLGISTIKYHNYSPEEVDIKVCSSDIKYFKNSYEDCRKEFLFLADQLDKKFNNVEIFKINVESKIDSNLYIDFCYIPAQKIKSKLLILSSAIHGIEGFVGSGVQQMTMTELLTEQSLDEMGILLIHAMNPYGFKYFRRFTENNVDLNRNCEIDENLYSSKNLGYTKLYNLLNPKGKVNLKSIRNRFFHISAIKKIITASMKILRQAVLQGQYEFQEGIYFGGNDREPQIKLITPVLKKISSEYQIIFNIDLHTGYGEYGTLHLFPNPVKNQKIQNDLEKIFKGYNIDWGNDEDFYTINGDFSNYIGKIIPEKYFLPMVFEFGTLNSQTTFGAIKSLNIVVNENQGNNYGFKTKKDKEIVFKSQLEMYYPSSKKWQTKVIQDSRKMMKSVLKNYNNLKIEDSDSTTQK